MHERKSAALIVGRALLNPRKRPMRRKSAAVVQGIETLEPRLMLSVVPQYDHVVIVIEENHSSGEIIGSPSAPYINSLAAQGANFSQYFATTHPSQPNYLVMFSGTNQGITNDTPPTVPFTTANLGASLRTAGFSFAGYSESQPSVGFLGTSSTTIAGQNQYMRKHNPWSDWQNDVSPTANQLPSSTNQPFTTLPADFTTLPTLSYVVPNEQNDMHDGSVAQGDAWLQSHIDAYAQWAKTHNSLLIVTWDEDDNSANNQIATFIVGQGVNVGTYSETLNHLNLLRTLEDMYGLPYAGASNTATPITDIWANAGPTISVAATDATAAEQGPDQGLFTFTRVGDTTAALTINIAVSGTATSGTDYAALPVAVTFLAGSSTATLSLNPIDDTTIESSETVTVTVSPSATYNIGTPSATVTIADNDGAVQSLISTGSTWKYLDDGSNQGTAWSAPTFNDTAWKSGAAQLGYGDGDEATVVGYGPDANNKFITTYFRKAFTITDAAAVNALNMSILRDDGAVVYLNGVEVYRSNMPTTVIAYNTLATVAIGGVDETTFLNAALSKASLLTGTNVLAVEIHQAALTSSDISFDLSLSADTSINPAPNAPTNLAATAAAVNQINLAWTDTSANETGLKIERATDSGFTANLTAFTAAANAVAFSDTTGLNPLTTYYYRVRATNSTGDSLNSNTASATTPAAVVTVAATDATASEQGPDQGLFTFTRTGSTAAALVVSFTRTGTATSGSDFTALPATVTIPIGAASATVAVKPLDDATVESTETVTVTITASANYALGATTAATVNIADNDSVPQTFIATGSTWKYLDDGSNQGTAWTGPTFNDTAWKSGAAQLGYGDGDEATVVGYGPDANNKFITTYFRQTFTVTDVTKVASLAINLLRDDGAVIYLNGTEVYRSNMPTGTITSTTPATVAIGGVDETTFLAAAISKAKLVNGINVLSVEIHQSGGTSSDISFDLSLIGAIATAPIPNAPTSATATSVSESQIDLKWTDTSASETGFTIERATNNTFTANLTTFTVGANVLAFGDSGLSSSTAYFYRVRATNSAGASPNSNTATATTKAASGIVAPSNLLLTVATNQQINLNWTDNSSNETGFKIERKTGINGTWAQIATVGAGVTTYSNTGLTAATLYYYRVRANTATANSSYTNYASATTAALPAPWVSSDIGAVAATGSAVSTNGLFTVKGSGADIFGTLDEFRFVYQDLTGDGTITARVVTVQNTNSWAKAGVMMRDTLAANSAAATMVISPSSGTAFEQRLTAGAATTTVTTAGIVVPYWVRLTRSGSTFTGYRSADGVTWTLVSSATITMGSTIKIGLAVTSHADGTLASATFDNVGVSNLVLAPAVASLQQTASLAPVTAADTAALDTTTGATKPNSRGKHTAAPQTSVLQAIGTRIDGRVDALVRSVL